VSPPLLGGRGSAEKALNFQCPTRESVGARGLERGLERGGGFLGVHVVDGTEGDRMVVCPGPGPTAGNRVVVVPFVGQSFAFLGIALKNDSFAPAPALTLTTWG